MPSSNKARAKQWEANRRKWLKRQHPTRRDRERDRMLRLKEKERKWECF